MPPAALQLGALWVLLLAALIADFGRPGERAPRVVEAPDAPPSRCLLCGSPLGDAPCGCWELWLI